MCQKSKAHVGPACFMNFTTFGGELKWPRFLLAKQRHLLHLGLTILICVKMRQTIHSPPKLSHLESTIHLGFLEFKYFLLLFDI